MTIFGIEPDQDLVRTGVEAVRGGYAISIVKPGGKVPICTLTARELKAAGPHHPCGVHHAITDDKKARTIIARMIKDLGPEHPLNLGIVAAPSKLICVDADNFDGVEAFKQRCALETGDFGWMSYTPTVRTPGSFVGGVWKHRDGGHFYFDWPADIEMPECIISQDGYDVRTGQHMAVAPPSVRPEGPYVAAGNVLDAPRWIVDLVLGHAATVAAKRAAHEASFPHDGIAAWAVRTSWSDLLLGDGWTDTTKLDDVCGCPIFEKPGGASTGHRSAIGHNSFCAVFSDQKEGHGPLHVFTTEPPEPLGEWLREHGTKNITKLQYESVMRYAGDIDAAKIGLGIVADVGLMLSRLEEITSVPADPKDVDDVDVPYVPVMIEDVVTESFWDGVTAPSETSETALGSDHEEKPLTCEDATSPIPTTIDGGDLGSGPRVRAETTKEHAFWMPDEDQKTRNQILEAAMKIEVYERAREFRDYLVAGDSLGMQVQSADKIVSDDVRPAVGYRTDGVPQLYPGRVNTIWGQSESAKSWYALACAIDALNRGQQILLLDVEDDSSGFVSRLKLLGQPLTSSAIYVRPLTAPTTRERNQLLAIARDSALVIVDSLDGFLALMKMVSSNDALAIRSANALLKSWSMAGNAAVLTVDHSTDKPTDNRPTTSMGSSAKKQVIDGVMLRADRMTQWKPKTVCETMITLGKDRHGHVKEFAVYDSKDADERQFGRLALLRMEPGVGDDPSSLRMLPPPSFEDLPTLTKPRISADQVRDIETLIMDFLMIKNPGEKFSRTDVLKAAGDKNNRNGTGEILDALVSRVGLHVEETTKGDSTIRRYWADKL